MLSHYVNKPVLVSIPSLFTDGLSRTCTLIGIESAGLWLKSEDLTKTLFPEIESSNVDTIFIPFAQIAYLAEGIAELPPPVDEIPATAPPDPKADGPEASQAKKRR